jgi:hypothetical protein
MVRVKQSSSYSFMTWGEGSASHPDPDLRGRDSGTRWTGGWVGLRAAWTQRGNCFDSDGGRTSTALLSSL